MAFETISIGTQPAGTGGDTARTAFEKVNRNFIAADVLAAAMSQAQFDANRNANKELYAASGWVSFGNHESGKQVNECKPGLYTVLTTPNTLLIGKAGGVGGSKTDYASVHIDGVIFNLTNQFILTLPSHPTSAMPERMDMYGVESEKVEISAAAPNAYQGGLRGVGAAVNLFTATDQQKKDFFAQNSNTTYIGSDGKIYQWQLYKISFAGTTNGLPSPTEQGYSLNSFGDLWLKAGKNLLYFGNVLRLNDGGYHPSHNPLGAAKFVGDTFWYNTTASITSRSDCFNPSKLLSGSGSIASGKSGRPEIGGRYYDAVYADGYGGVCRDMRYSAYGITSEDFAEADQRVKNGTYRGFELPPITVTGIATPYLSSLTVDLANYGDVSQIRQTKHTSSEGSTAPRYKICNARTGQTIDTTGWSAGLEEKVYLGVLSDVVAGDKILVLANNINGQLLSRASVGGSFLQTDVIGSPVNILATPALANGWQGGWGGMFDGTPKRHPLTRKSLSSASIASIYTDNSGSSWLPWGAGIDTAANMFPNSASSNPSGRVAIIPYQAFAKQTEPAANSVVHGGMNGICSVFASANYKTFNGNLLCESLIGKVLTLASGVEENYTTPAQGVRFYLDAKRIADGSAVQHNQVLIENGGVGNVAFKALNYNVNINQQAFIQYAYTELKHNGTNWGDDDKVSIVDNQATKTNLNGNTVLVGTAKLKEKIGLIRNKV